jgi:hypothetical protein
MSTIQVLVKLSGVVQMLIYCTPEHTEGTENKYTCGVTNICQDVQGTAKEQRSGSEREYVTKLKVNTHM